MTGNKKQNLMVFVGGASRSGTTLFENLLDSHPELYVIPNETHIQHLFSYYNQKNGLYFYRDYIFHHDCALIYSQAALENYNTAITRKYKTDPVNFTANSFEEFLARFYTEIKNNLSMEGLYRGYANAISNSRLKNKIIVEKRPIDNEVYALEIKKRIPGAKFIHLLRDPRTRYVSLKTKRSYKNFWGRLITGENVFGIPFFVLHPLISMMSFNLAKVNKQILQDDYLVILYEDLIKAPEQIMEKVSRFIGIDFHEILLQQTHDGQSKQGASSVEAIGSGVKDISKERLARYIQITSPLERKVLNYLTWEVANEFGYNIERQEQLRRRELLEIIKGERLWNIWWHRKFIRQHFMFAQPAITRSKLYQWGIDHFLTDNPLSD